MFSEIRTEHAPAGHGAELIGYPDEIVVPLRQEMGTPWALARMATRSPAASTSRTS